MTAQREAAQGYAADFGWPVFPLRPESKAPYTHHGFKDATTDPAVIADWFERWSDAGVGIATGAPGPHVLDVDDLVGGRDAVASAEASGPPTVATVRGRHFYFAGEQRATVDLNYGELRGTGSYVIAPPSVHPSGKAYVWLVEPSGPLPPLPAALATLAAGRSTAGRGEHRPPVERVPHGQRWPYLRDVAVRLARGGFTDEALVLAHLRLEYERVCEPLPAPAPGSLERLAAWVVGSDIVEREERLGAMLERIGGLR